MKTAQDILKNGGGDYSGGFNQRLFGDTRPAHSAGVDCYKGWTLANDLIMEGKLFYVHIFKHLSFGSVCGDKSFSYGGSQVCNGCGRAGLQEPWWTVKVFKDGNAWICTGEDFENLQESNNYAFGDTRDEALKNYELLFLSEEEIK